MKTLENDQNETQSPTFYFTVALLALSLTSITIHAQNLGDSKVFSPVAAPGYPEGIAVNGNTFYVSGPAAFGQPLGSTYVKAYDLKTGAFEASYPITITNSFAGMSGASCAAFGPDGDLYVVEPFVDHLIQRPGPIQPTSLSTKRPARYW